MRKSFAALVKPASSACNMRCRYCFYADVSRSRAVQNYGLMTPDTLEALVKKAFDYADGQVAFTFQGGEPTLAGLSFYRTLIELEKRCNTRRVPVRHAIQTNGLLLDGEWADFLRDNNFLTGLSMDGCRVRHDGARVDARGEGTFSRVCDAADLLKSTARTSTYCASSPARSPGTERRPTHICADAASAIFSSFPALTPSAGTPLPIR